MTLQTYINRSILNFQVLFFLNCTKDISDNVRFLRILKNKKKKKLYYSRLILFFFHFLGADVVELAWNYQGVKLQTESFIRSVTSDSGQAFAWLSDYNLEHNSTSRRRTADALAFLPQVSAKVSKLEQEANKTLSRYFDELVVNEWLEQRIGPLVKGLKDVERRGPHGP